VPHRFSRTAVALVAAGAAACSLCLSGAAASADSVRQSEWWLAELDISTAWTISQGAGVTVAVLSDGVDTSQVDLAGVVKTASAPAGAPTPSGQFAGEQGTEIASLIAGRGHGPGGRSGMLGVAPLSRILSIQVTLPPGDPALTDSTVAAGIPDAIAAGIMAAVKAGARVIDLPLDPAQPDATGAGGDPAAAGGSPQEKAAVNYALSHDVVLVAPAGDDETSTDAPNFPAAYPGVIAVGAFNDKFTKAPFSSRDSYVTVTAAGQGVIAATNTGGYQVVNSTSAASAIVSGIVAQIRSRYPGLTVNEVRKALTSSTVWGHHGGNGSGFGTVDASRALAAAASIATPTSSLAGSRAQAALLPSAAAASVTTAAVAPRLIRAAEISGGLLVVLLLLIAWYASARRRRAKRTQAATADWAHRSGQSRYPQAKPASDGVLEYFAAPPTAQAGGSAAAIAGRAPFAAGQVGRDGSGMPPWASARTAEDSGGLPAIAPASRAVSKRPSVSGTPPWEPAAPPANDAPWAAAQGLSPADGQAAVTARPSAMPAAPRPSAPTWADTPAAPDASVTRAGDSIWGSAVSARSEGRGTGLLGEPVVRQSPASDYPADRTEEPLPRSDAATLPRSDAATLLGRPQRPSTLAPWDSSGSPESTDPAADLTQPAGEGSAAEWARQASWPRASGQPAGVDPLPRLLERTDVADVGAGTWREAVARPAGPSPTGWDQAGAPDAGASGADATPRVTAAGLPVRLPRNVSPEPLSPSGSLWEPATRRTGERPQADYPAGSHERRDSDWRGSDWRERRDSAWRDARHAEPGPADGTAPAGYDSGGRPADFWNPPAATDTFGAQPGE
jgi:Subtilase family